MNWKYFLPLPLAAFLFGQPLHAPKLREPLPPASDACEREARALYLRAYAYASENPFAARRLLAAAERALCAEAAPELRARMLELKKALFL